MAGDRNKAKMQVPIGLSQNKNTEQEAPKVT